MKPFRFPAAAAVLLLVFVAGCVISRNPVSGRKRAYGYSWEQEVAIGRDADQAIIAEYGVYDDPKLAAYVDSLGQHILSFSHLRRPDTPAEFSTTPFTFRVLDSPVINAFALPGGFVYVTRGLMAYLENEAQLAVVIGHEIGHVAARHGSKRAATQNLGQALLIGGAVGGQVLFGGDVGQGILQAGSSAVQLLFLSYGRGDEMESDRLGVEYASMAGYNGGEGGGFFRSLARLGEQSGQRLPSFLSTHPDPGQREQTIYQLASDWAEQLTTDRVERDSYLARVDGVVAGENPRNGFEQNSVFYHPSLAFQFPVPTGYQVVNQANQVVIVEPNQQAVVYLTIDSESSSARAAAEKFAAQDGLTVVRSGIGSAYGLPAQFVVGDATGQDGQVVRVRGQFVEYNERVYAFTGLTLQSAYPTHEPAFIRAMQGFAPLRDPEVLSIQPSRLSLTRASQAAAFRTLLPGSIPPPFDPDGLAIMNQTELDSQIAAGTAIKLIR